ncbi:FMN-binding protein [uncultured Croceitalea sp.]|uniref:FMN-binding protein n=1 Tax=uncultured Croceitalea sp. TaxID=1798908 RepID=UPI003305C10E
MLKENKIASLKLLVPCMFFLMLGFTPVQLSPRLKEKLHNAVQSTFAIDGFNLELLEVSKDINAKTAVELGGENLFRIKKDEKLLGFVYLGEAPSMKNVFDYVILFNPDLSVKKSKVLIYRENHGRQIGSQRWLKQFIGLKVGDSVTYGKEIDAIAGATISAKSMTNAIAEVLESMTVLHDEKVL